MRALRSTVRAALPAALLLLLAVTLTGCVARGDGGGGFIFGGYGLIGLLILVLDIVAILKVWQSGASTLAKLIWTVVILVFPVLGLLLWLLMGPGGKA